MNELVESFGAVLSNCLFDDNVKQLYFFYPKVDVIAPSNYGVFVLTCQ